MLLAAATTRCGAVVITRTRVNRTTSFVATRAMAARTAVDEVTTTGAFARTPSTYRHAIEPGGRFAPEAGRYVLYVSYACPWACRCLAALHLKGLQDAIAVSVVHPTWQRTRPDDPSDEHTGWTFRAPNDKPVSSSTGHGSFDCAGCVPDPVNGARFVRDLYERAGDTTGKYSVPVLWDKREGTIVNNESAEIVRMFNSAFNGAEGGGADASKPIAKHPEVDLSPEHLRAEIDALNEWIYRDINNGVYRCGFATKQAPYEEAFEALFAALDRCEAILAERRFLCGNSDAPTEADIRLFMTLIRFDEVYVVYFKTNKRRIQDYPHLSGYVRDLMASFPGIAASVNMSHIKTHYYTSHPVLNTYAVIPVGGPSWWLEPSSDRAQKFGGSKA